MLNRCKNRNIKTEKNSMLLETPQFFLEIEHQTKFIFSVFCFLMNIKSAHCIYDENLSLRKYSDKRRASAINFLRRLSTTIFSIVDEINRMELRAPAHYTYKVIREDDR